MKRVFVFPALLLTIAIAALAGCKATKPPKVWPQEPETFLGVRLGAPLASSLHPCNPQSSEHVPCFEAPEGRTTIQNVDGYWEIVVDALDGNVSGISAFYDRDTGDHVLADLVKQFGNPQEKSPEENGTRAAWKGSDITIMFFNNKDGSGFVSAGLNDHRHKAADPHPRRRWGLF